MVGRRRSGKPSTVWLGAPLVALVFCVALMAASAAQAQLSLTTLFAANNGFAGNTFDIEAKKPGGFEVESLDVNLEGAGPSQVEVWTRPGTSVGFEGALTGWTSQGSVTVTPAAVNTPTPVPIGFSLATGTHGIAVGVTDYPSSSMRYTNGGPTDFENDDLKLTTHAGLGSPPLGGTVFDLRQWNGTVHYSRLTAQCKDLQAAVGSAEMDLSVANGALATANQALGAANQALGEAGDEVEAAKGKKQRAQKKVRRAKKKLKRAKGSGDQAKVKKAKKRVKRAKKRLRSAKRRLRDARGALGAAEDTANQAQGGVNQAQSSANQAQTALNQAQAAFNTSCA